MSQHQRPDNSLDLLTKNHTLVIKHEFNTANVLFNYEDRVEYTISSVDGEPLGTMQERSTGALGMIGRQIATSKRHFNIDVFNNDKESILTIKRNFQVLTSKVFIIHNGYVIGKSVESFGIRKRYELFVVKNGKEFLVSDKRSDKDSNYHKFGKIKQGIFSYTFPILNDHGNTIASIDRNLTGVLLESFIGGGVFVVKMDSDDPFSGPGLGTKERAVLLACAISIDFDHFFKEE